MAQRGDVIDNPVTGQRMVFEVTAAESGGERFVAEGIFPPGGFAGVSHIHPFQDEFFEVLAGTAAFEVAGERRVLGTGESIDIPRGTRHTFANAGNDEMRVRLEFRPGLQSTGRFYELYFAFAQEGRVNARAMPDLLDVATVWPLTSEHAILAAPPAFAQDVLFRLLAPIAQLARRRLPVCRTTAVGRTSAGGSTRDPDRPRRAA
jgi:quercetin dioxygenase-like cupin family protein